jgi:hypothetical protein
MVTSYEIGDGRKTLFWHDVWWGKCPFKIMFLALFECCEQMDISVNEALHGGEVNLSFCRSFGPREVVQWEELGVTLGQVSLDAVRDKVCWELERSKKFSTHPLYRYILDPGVKDLCAMEIWKCRIPLKQKNFLWLCFRGRIQ